MRQFAWYPLCSLVPLFLSVDIKGKYKKYINGADLTEKLSRYTLYVRELARSGKRSFVRSQQPSQGHIF
jgi:hypothetical protein